MEKMRFRHCLFCGGFFRPKKMKHYYCTKKCFKDSAEDYKKHNQGGFKK